MIWAGEHGSDGSAGKALHKCEGLSSDPESLGNPGGHDNLPATRSQRQDPRAGWLAIPAVLVSPRFNRETVPQ